MESGNNRNNPQGRGRPNSQDQGGERGRGRDHRNQHPTPQDNQPHGVGPRRPPFQGNQPPTQQPRQADQWIRRPPFQGNQSPSQQPRQQGVGRASAWAPRPWAPPSSASPPPVQLQHPRLISPQPSTDEPKKQLHETFEQLQLTASSGKEENPMQPIRRPDKGGTISKKSIRLFVNHFPVLYDPQRTIIHYDVDIKPVLSDDKRCVKKLRKSDMRLIRDKLFSDDPAQFPILKTAYDGEKNIFSAVPLPTGKFKVEISDGEDMKAGTYIFTIKPVNELKLSKLNDYIRGNLPYIPREILQGMDLVMKEKPSRERISVGRSFYSSDYRNQDDLHCGVAAYRGYQQSLKPTSQGLSLCLDYSVLSFRKPWPVIEFLKEHIPGFKGANDVKRLRREVNSALKNLKVTVTHRRTKQKYTVSGLTPEDARDSYFDLVDPEGNNPPKRTSLIKYFQDKWGKEVMHPNIPCLELGKNNKSNKVPLEFCVLVEGQRYPKEYLDKDAALLLKNLSLVKPWVRKDTINNMVANDGPCGDVTRNFGIGLDVNMTRVVGRVIGAPMLKVGASRSVEVDAEKCQWNLVGKSVVDGKSLERWVLLDFTDGDRCKLQASAFINSLRGRSRNLGMRMEEPILHWVTLMNELSSVDRVEDLLRRVVGEAGKRSKGNIQMIICAMTRIDPGYKSLKWVSETRIGVVTQCCLSFPANKGQDQYLANLCLKINAKLGGSNFELIGRLPHFENENHVMFIGADVNHSGPVNSPCPSIAAVVGTMNWPAANRYAARVSPQARRTEKISSFGAMCLDLVNTYARLNKAKPARIVVFRDGVSDGQFEMVLTELLDLKKAIYDDHYQPTITLIVAQKRHQTRLFVENRNDGGASGNVPPGTVVDTKIVHPLDFDFYLCSHYGGLGTSKPTHYYVLWDENGFTSDGLQKLLYDMCFTFARCTKPVSLVPPVYYADLVAYRGRMFQEAMETQSPSSSYSFASAFSSLSSTSTFDQSFYNLHPDLENIMFFV